MAKKKNKAKGIRKCVIKHNIKSDVYKTCLSDKKERKEKIIEVLKENNYDVDDWYKRSVKFFKGNKTILKSQQWINRNQDTK